MESIMDRAVHQMYYVIAFYVIEVDYFWKSTFFLNIGTFGALK